MNSVICTLFEGRYHYGVAALTNSLYVNGYRGILYAGYRGALPPWATALKQIGNIQEFKVAEELFIRFIPLNTKAHLTNYKPDFMLSLWNNYCQNADAIFYFDPDIVIRCNWSFYEDWAAGGVALCEDVNSPIPVNHPLRIQWVKLYKQYEIALNFSNDIYVNGGFQGIIKSNYGFLEDWQRVQRVMEVEIGGMEKTGRDIGGREKLFAKTDQDALNITLGLNKLPVSIIGKEGMDIAPGGFTMSHTIGSYKAWNTNFVLEAFAGRPPAFAAKNYFEFVSQPIRIYTNNELHRKKIELKIASAIGRFYRRV